MDLKSALWQLPVYIKSTIKGFRYPPGHHHSAVPNADQVQAFLDRPPVLRNELPEIRLNTAGQRDLLESFARHYHRLPFPEQKHPDFRYYFGQSWFCYADAVFLFCFLNEFRPRRIIEVGSGFSTAVILDTIDGMPGYECELRCIEPFPDRLKKLLKATDDVELTRRQVQTVSPAVFETLQDGDLLFIDSSHVLKTGSDLQYLFFQILPILSPGVFVHFHDIFFPFEYPETWIAEGRYWNECYFIRSFLAYNQAWQIRFFNHFVSMEFREFLETHMPLCLKNPGGSLYLQKRAADADR